MPWTIAPKSYVYSLYGQDSTTFKDEWSETAEDMLLDHVGKSMSEVTTATSFTEYISGGGDRMILTEHPISSLTAVTIIHDGADDESVSLNNIRFVGREIILKEGSFPRGLRNIKVEYDGTVAEKKIYKFAVALMIIAILNFEGRKGSDSNIEWSALNDEFGNNTANENLGLLSHLNAILDELITKKSKVLIR